MTAPSSTAAETERREETGLRDAIASARAQDGRSLAEISSGRSVLVVFLRHSGCPFCREAIADASRVIDRLRSEQVELVFVTQWPPGPEDELFDKAGLSSALRIDDPDRSLYRAFELKRGNLWQIAGPFVWLRVLSAGLRGHRVGRAVGNAFQMPGVFLVRDGRVIRSYRHRSQASRPDLCALAGVAGGA